MNSFVVWLLPVLAIWLVIEVVVWRKLYAKNTRLPRPASDEDGGSAQVAYEQLSQSQYPELVQLVTVMIVQDLMNEGLMEGPVMLTPKGVSEADQAYASGVRPTPTEVTSVLIKLACRGVQMDLPKVRDLIIYRLEEMERSTCE